MSSNFDSFFYLLFCFTNVLLYTLFKFFAKSFGVSPQHIASYMNIGVFLCYNLFFVKKIWKEKMYFSFWKAGNLILSFSVLSAVTKLYAIKYIEPRDAFVISYSTPLVVMLFANVFLKEQMIWRYWICGGLSLIGIYIYINAKFHLNNIYYAIMLLHVLFKAVMHIGTKKGVKKGVFNVMFYENLFYSTFALVFFHFNGGFDLHIMFSWQNLLLMITTTISLASFTLAYKLAHRGITHLQNLDFSRLIFSFIFALTLLNDHIKFDELIGAGIILFSIILSRVNFTKKANKSLFF